MEEEEETQNLVKEEAGETVAYIIIGRRVGTVSGAGAVELRDDEELTEEGRVFHRRDVPNPSQRAREPEHENKRPEVSERRIRWIKHTRFYIRMRDQS